MKSPFRVSQELNMEIFLGHSTVSLLITLRMVNKSYFNRTDLLDYIYQSYDGTRIDFYVYYRPKSKRDDVFIMRIFETINQILG